MSEYSVSERGARAACVSLARSIAAACLMAGLIALSPATGSARTPRHGIAVGDRVDSGRTVSRITISDEGVQVSDDASDSAGVSSDGRTHVSRDVRIAGARVRTGRDDDRTGSVEVHGPVVVVDDNEAGRVRVFSDVEVDPGEVVDGSVVSVFGSGTIAGEVNGDVVAVFGSVRLKPGAVVNGDVVAVGGVVEHPAGTVIRGEITPIEFLPVSLGLPTGPVLMAIILCAWLLNVFGAWLLTVLFPARMLRIATTASRRTMPSFFLGLATGPLALLVAFLLLITVVGIPVALLLPIFLLGIEWMGRSCASYIIGCRLLGRRFGEGGMLGPIAAGMLLVAAFFGIGAGLLSAPSIARPAALFFGLLGILFFAGLSAIGTGAVLLSRFGSPSSEERSPGQPAGPVVTGPPPAPGTAVLTPPIA